MVELIPGGPRLVAGFTRSSSDPEGEALRSSGAGELVLLRQVHRADVFRYRPGDRRHLNEPFDGVVIDRPGVAGGIRTADCIPLVAADQDGSALLLAHCGWRSLSARIVPRAIEVAQACGFDPARAIALTGPFIQPCCYTVGADLADGFQRVFGEDVAVFRDARWHLDLGMALCRELERSGLEPGRIVPDRRCTACRPGLHSYRGQRTAERHITFAALTG